MSETEFAPQASAATSVRAWAALPGIRRMSAARAALQARLGGGCTLDLWPERAPDARLRMTLYAGDDSAQQAPDWSAALHLHGPCGALELSSGARWLRALSGIDLDEGLGLDDDWLCGALLGTLDGTPLEACARVQRGGIGPLDDEVVLNWVLHDGRHSVACHARAGAATWNALLARAGWRTRTAPLAHFPHLPVNAAIVLARHTLPHHAAHALRPGDIVLPDAPLFDPAGRGRLRLAGHQLDVAWRAPNHLDILHLEPLMEHDIDNGDGELPLSEIAHAVHDVHDTHDTHDAPAAAIDGDALPAVPVTLDFVLGRVQLPLARLQALAPGSVLELSHGSPLEVAIDCGGRFLGHAELLDVEGRLGLRVTRWGGAA